MTGGFETVSDARILYLVLLGLALSVGLFARYRGRGGEALGHAGLWAAIIAGAAILVWLSGAAG